MDEEDAQQQCRRAAFAVQVCAFEVSAVTAALGMPTVHADETNHTAH